ncbi:hypothetical protein SAMN05428989_0234 [Pseudoxanthomonas sp. GM95]|uniref:hypothetical protein n=1 Tax=Pseudoxanthomonas sp. GM95 TaxID=1881043 RepID=UPI0008AD9034|nr:hypothetical protein [Pseudoxanthomonas sp. GM95]SEK50202.1 hypothetical protein SAMN05428989_0234 [Pseudoxanthomonas sp. GM95]
MNNPYQGPRANVAPLPLASAVLDDVAAGQRWVVYAILLYFVAMLAANAITAPVASLLITTLIVFACVGLSWAGIYRLSRGLGYPLWWRIGLLVLMLIPLVGLLILVMLSSRATKRLRAAGYRVGLLGARAS